MFDYFEAFAPRCSKINANHICRKAITTSEESFLDMSQTVQHPHWDILMEF